MYRKTLSKTVEAPILNHQPGDFVISRHSRPWHVPSRRSQHRLHGERRAVLGLGFRGLGFRDLGFRLRGLGFRV